MQTINISLSEEFISFIENKISSGLFNSPSEIICEALIQLDKEETFIRNQQLSQLKDALAKGIQEAENQEFANYSFEELILEIEQRANKI